jgi:hypothetical protein
MSSRADVYTLRALTVVIDRGPGIYYAPRGQFSTGVHDAAGKHNDAGSEPRVRTHGRSGVLDNWQGEARSPCARQQIEPQMRIAYRREKLDGLIEQPREVIETPNDRPNS